MTKCFRLKNPRWYLLVETKEGASCGWSCSKCISSGAQYVTPRQYFSHPSLVMYSFATPPIKPKLGQKIGGRLLIANHLNQSLWWANQKTLSSSKIRFITLFSCCCALYQPQQHMQLCWAAKNQFPESNRHMLDFLYPIVLCRITYWAPPLEML